MLANEASQPNYSQPGQRTCAVQVVPQVQQQPLQQVHVL